MPRPLRARQASVTIFRKGADTAPARAERETTMAWTTPTLVEICVGLEINGYMPAEF